MTRPRGGVVLLEVLVALMILAIAGIALMEFVEQVEYAVRQSDVRSKELVSANGFMESVALWPRVDLDRHLGRHPEGEFELVIDRPTSTLYHVVLARRPSNGKIGAPLFDTILFRADQQ